jgi:hypothetical protein
MLFLHSAGQIERGADKAFLVWRTLQQNIDKNENNQYPGIRRIYVA